MFLFGIGYYDTSPFIATFYGMVRRLSLHIFRLANLEGKEEIGAIMERALVKKQGQEMLSFPKFLSCHLLTSPCE